MLLIGYYSCFDFVWMQICNRFFINVQLIYLMLQFLIATITFPIPQPLFSLSLPLYFIFLFLCFPYTFSLTHGRYRNYRCTNTNSRYINCVRIHGLVVRVSYSQLPCYGFNFQTLQSIMLLSKTLQSSLLHSTQL